MKHITTFLIFCLLLSCDNNSDERLIEQTFQTYKSCIINDDGNGALKVVDKRTVNHYKRILELTISADSTTIVTLPTMDKFFVLAIRHAVSPDSILKMTGEGLFIFAIKNGMVGKEGAMALDIGNISIDNDFAVAEFTSDGKLTGIKINFYKDNGTWRFDLSSFFQVGNIAFKKLLKECPTPENECITEILESNYGKNGRDIWHPIKPTKRTAANTGQLRQRGFVGQRSRRDKWPG